MASQFDDRLAALIDGGCDAVTGALTGLEKESLRVAPDGFIAATPHPIGLGAALTNRFITTDFSEALLEFVTPAYDAPAQALQCLHDIHQFTMTALRDEYLWNSSMPCLLGDDQSIPLARYGSSNVAQMKTIYRRGLSYRYGRAMQAIAGIHFNFSLPEAFWTHYQEVCGDTRPLAAFTDDAYLALARNFRRVGWIVLYLFGASPVMCKSFLGDRQSALAEFDADTLFEPYATSLRMSDLGYNSNAQSSLRISLNTLDAYIEGLTAAIMTPHAPYEEIGIKQGGQWRQLNTSILQIENEYYNTIRPKQVANSGERPTLALQRAGVAYVEIRSLDINPFSPVGITEDQLRYMQALLLYCLLTPSPKIDDEELAEHIANHGLVAHSGRAPALQLRRRGDDVLLSDWAAEIHAGVTAIAEWMDTGNGNMISAVRSMDDVVADPEHSLSARVLREMREQGLPYHLYAMQQAREDAAYFNMLPPLPDDLATAMRREASESLQRQQAIEAADDVDFDEYLAAYYR
ncbi:MAG: glutamate--cysteine ligase [Pseudomonadota bacterium]